MCSVLIRSMSKLDLEYCIQKPYFILAWIFVWKCYLFLDWILDTTLHFACELKKCLNGGLESHVLQNILDCEINSRLVLSAWERCDHLVPMCFLGFILVFDDGDERTLRRTSLCLKGERHFAESEVRQWWTCSEN